ncbi:sulfite exporter TauE/SafE family protein [Pallidibacillus pasinlerensis]|uniref:Probable membrane transporter protein n=1 Tax=Pallidibacillus pasinlerensis TaxID=2703818 RepID=A0ABX0A4H2_9BACI|nr:sulfite exporter TauE/SafE family protein [Pallidibacillus pasinlerensis]NCU18328.1 sulfite exporter TauE/SafE family protein [Pallidibacillus pasinlerensis]
MEKIIILAFVGFCAQLVDGALGMAYGVTSTSLLLLSGIAPAVSSASVHMAEVVTTAASGISHIKFGNVDKQVVKRLIIPGSIGAFLGATFLSNIPGEIIKPYIAIFLLSLGFFVIYKFLFKINKKQPVKQKSSSKNKQLAPLGFIAGFMDSTGGGGWGPIATPVLLTSHNMEPRKVVGSVDTSEFAIAISASLGFLISLGWQEIAFEWVIALMIGGIFAAPLAAWLVKIIPTILLGTLVGGVIIITNVRTLLSVIYISSTMTNIIYIILFVLWIISVIYAVFEIRKHKNNEKERPLKSD